MNTSPRYTPGRTWRVIYPVLIYVLVSTVVTFFYVMYLEAGMMLDEGALSQESLIEAVNASALEITALTMLGTAIVCGIFYRKDLKRFKPMRVEKSPAMYLLIVFFAPAMTIALNALMSLTGLFEAFYQDYEMMEEVIYGHSTLLEVTATVVLAPLAEELLFRGLIFKRLRTFHRFRPAMFMSAIIFGMYHGNVLQGVYAFFLGLTLAFIFEHYRTIWACVLFHAAANGISVLLSESEVISELLARDSISLGVIAASFVLTIGGLYIMMEYFRKTEEI